MARIMADGYLEGNMMNVQLNLHIAFKRNEQFPNKKVISYMDDDSVHTYTYRDFQERVRRAANMLISLGVKRGQRVATFGYNHYQHLELYFAIPLIGAVLHTLNFRLFADQIAYIVNHAEDVVIFTEGTLVNLLEPLHKAGRLPSVKHFVLIGCKQVSTSLSPVENYESLIAASSPSFVFDENLPENAALGLCYTSGTTGNPKGVLYSHRSTMLSALGAIFPQVYPLSDFDTLLCIVPMFHANAWGFPFIAVLQGTDIILPGKDLSPPRLAQLLTSHPVTFTCGVPTIWLTVYDELKKIKAAKGAKFNLNGVRILSSGFACPDFLLKNYESEFGVKMVQAWGMTELSPFGSIARLQPHHLLLPEDEQLRLRLVQGTPQPLTQIRLIDDEGKPVPKDNRTVGNIQIRGPYVVSRYFRDESGTASFTPDGFLKTGDVAVWDTEGYMRLVDRSKDLIKSGGEWISSVELEHHIAAHPAVQDAAVVGVPHQRFQERPLALVVLRAGQSVTKRELTKLLESKVAKWWIPDDIKFVNSLPKTSVGKPDKKAMRAAHENHYLKAPRAAL